MKPNQIKYHNFQRLQEIILTANPRFNKYFTASDYEIEFWIENGYYLYRPFFKDTVSKTSDFRLNIIKQLKDLLIENGFKEYSVIK